MRPLAFAIVFILARASGAQDAAVPPEPGMLGSAMVEGAVTAVDPLAHRFVVVREDGPDETFRIDPTTIVLRGDRRLHGHRLAPGQRVRVHPREGGAPRVAGVVEILALGQDPDAPPGSRAAEVGAVRDAAHGRVLIDAEGRALYTFSADERGENGPPESRCVDECAELWPPLETNGAPIAKAGVSAARLARFEREPRVHQVSYDGWPLYRFHGDEPFASGAGGSIRGNERRAFGGTWRVAPAGDAMEEQKELGGAPARAACAREPC